MRTLSGRTVALLEGRQSGELADMVARLGGTPVSAPAVRERPTTIDAGPMLDAPHRRRVSYAIVLTGAGATALFTEAERRGRLDEVRQAMAALTIISRGPKPQTALKRYGLTASVVTAKPHTTHELLEALDQVDLDGVPVLLLHYGEMNASFTDALAARGARVEDLCLYEWALPEDVEPIRALVERVRRQRRSMRCSSPARFSSAFSSNSRRQSGLAADAHRRAQRGCRRRRGRPGLRRGAARRRRRARTCCRRHQTVRLSSAPWPTTSS